MSPYRKGALFVVRLAGFGFIIASFGLMWSDVYLILARGQPAQPAMLALKSIPFLIGCAILLKSYAIAKSLTRDLDDEEDDDETG